MISKTNGRLTKHVPAHNVTVRFDWVKIDWMCFDQRYRDARARMRKPLDSCYWCRRKFNDGEMMSLVSPPNGKGGNKLLCPDCAADINFETVEVKPE